MGKTLADPSLFVCILSDVFMQLRVSFGRMDKLLLTSQEMTAYSVAPKDDDVAVEFDHVTASWNTEVRRMVFNEEKIYFWVCSREKEILVSL